MKKMNILLLLALVMLAACSKDNTAIDQPVKLAEGKIYATIENDEDSRIQLNDQMQTVWTEGDKIVVFGPTSYARYAYDGKTGDRAGSFTKTDDFTAANGKFKKFYALASTDSYVDFMTTSATAEEIIATFPDHQNYISGSYGAGANVMIGSSDDGTTFAFKNLSAYLRVSLTGTKKVSHIELAGNSDEIIAGKAYFKYDDLYNPSYRFETGYSRTIRLDCGDEGVQLSEVEPTEFTFAMIPTTFNKGFSILVCFTDGSVFPQSTTKTIKFDRNRISPMKVVSTEFSDWQKIYIYHSGLTIAAPQIGGAFVSGSIHWGDDNYSTLGTSVDYNYTDGNPSHTVSIQAIGGTSLNLNHLDGVTKIDLSNF